MHNILIVDDEQNFLDSLVDGLSDYPGYRLFSAANGRIAMETLRTTSIDLVVTDLKMPEMGGYELVAHMARKYSDVPVMVMTAFGSVEMVENFRALGVAAVLEKPLDFDELADKIADVLIDQQTVGETRMLSPSGDQLLRVLYEATHGGLDGEAIVRRDSAVGRIFVARGRIAWVAASTVNQSLFTCILDNSSVGMEELKTAFDECRRTGANFGETLIDWGLIDRDAFYEILAQYTARSLLEVFSWHDTVVMFVPEKRAYNSSLTFGLDEILGWVQDMDVDAQLGFEMPDFSDVASEAAQLASVIESELEGVSDLEGFINVGAFTATGVLLAEVSSVGISLSDVGSMANGVLLDAQHATDLSGLGRGNMVHIAAPEADILVCCHNESKNFATSEPGKAHLHLVLLLEAQSNLALGKLKLRRVIDALAPVMRQSNSETGRHEPSTDHKER